HGPVAGCRKWEESQLDDDGQNDDRPTPVAEQRMNVPQQPEDRLGNEPENAVVDRQTQTWRQFFQLVLAFRTGIERGAGFALATSRHSDCRSGEADDVVALAVLAGLHLVGVACL